MPGRTGLALIVIVLAGCSGATAAPSPIPSTAPAASSALAPAAVTLAPAAVTIEAGIGGASGEPSSVNNVFKPTTLEIKSGDVLRVVNGGDVEHDFTIDATGALPASPESAKDRVKIDVNLVKTTAQAKIDLPPGTYVFYCSIDYGSGAGHASADGTGMVGTLTVH